MPAASGRALPFGDLANCATAAGADVDAGVQLANFIAGGWGCAVIPYLNHDVLQAASSWPKACATVEISDKLWQ